MAETISKLLAIATLLLSISNVMADGHPSLPVERTTLAEISRLGDLTLSEQELIQAMNRTDSPDDYFNNVVSLIKVNDFSIEETGVRPRKPPRIHRTAVAQHQSVGDFQRRLRLQGMGSTDLPPRRATAV